MNFRQVQKKILSTNFASPGIIVLLSLAIIPIFVTDQFILQLLTSALIYGTLAMGFDFTVGFINVVNFGYAAFWGMGAYTSALLAVKLGLSPWLGIIGGVVLAGLLGFLVGWLTLRFHGIFAAVMAWFTGLGLMAIVTNWNGLTRGPLGLMTPMLFETMERLPYFFVILGIVAVTYLTLFTIANSRIGLNFKAIGQDEKVAKASGVDPTWYRVFNFTVSTAIAGLAGGFYAHFLGILSPEVMKTSHTIEIMALVYVGGRGSVWGPLVAALIFIPGLTYLQSLMEFKLIIYGLVLIGVMVFYPGGISSLYERMIKYLKSEEAQSISQTGRG